MSLKIIITGATGFVGEGVLLESLQQPAVTELLMINRRHFDLQHPKLKELIVPDFFELDRYAENLKGYDACFYCAGISSVGMNEEKYTTITYNTTLSFASTLLALNPRMVFNFVSGSHTDSSEMGRLMWARVKGKTENGLMKLAFKGQYNFRPGGMIASAGQKNAKPLYKIIVKIIALITPKKVNTLKQIALAMINTTLKGYPKQILEVSDITESAKALSA